MISMPGPTAFLPVPRKVTSTAESVHLPDQALVVIPNGSLLFEAQTAQAALLEFAGLSWPVVAGHEYAQTGLLLEIEGSIPQAEGYQLATRDGMILIRGADSAGVYYGVCTLMQMLQQHGRDLPGVTINDWPDFPARGMMLDISRDKVPTFETTRALIDRLAKLKINQVQLYMEHTFAYRQHPEVWAEASPFTGEEILELDAFCRQRHVELVPNQNSLGHMERWLKFERYNGLAEAPDGYDMPWRKNNPPTSLNPLDPGSIELIGSLYDELLPHFSSKKFNVGGDEPWELGTVRSKAERARIGEGRLYLNYLLKLYEQVTVRRKQMMFWDDIIVKYPDLVPELPYDVIAMVWGYEASHPFDERCALFLGSGIPFYVCPGTSSWNTFAGRTDNAIGNLRSAALNGLKHGSIGFLITDWGDRGHCQQNSMSYLGFAYGAAVSWAQDANLNLDLPHLLDLFVFEDEAGIMGKLVYDLGNMYQIPGHGRFNGHALVDVLRAPAAAFAEQRALWAKLQNPDETPWQTYARLMKLAFSGESGDIDPEVFKAAQRSVGTNGLLLADAESYRQALAQVGEILAPLQQTSMRRPDANLLKAEFELAGDFIRHSARRGLFMLGEGDASAAELKVELEGLIARYRENWLARNRPGGLDDSAAHFDNALNGYG
ncbi:MAG: family 20 glycosylhydrolase [Anaerolineae bacterium]|nr:family 20 glycosylhydrolase [Anaerolineae bacterium]